MISYFFLMSRALYSIMNESRLSSVVRLLSLYLRGPRNETFSYRDNGRNVCCLLILKRMASAMSNTMTADITRPKTMLFVS